MPLVAAALVEKERRQTVSLLVSALSFRAVCTALAACSQVLLPVGTSTTKYSVPAGAATLLSLPLVRVRPASLVVSFAANASATVFAAAFRSTLPFLSFSV